MAVYAPDCHEDLDVYETFLKNVTRVLWEERRALANDFCITVTSMWSWGHNAQMKTTVKSSMTCMGVVLARMRQRSRRFQETDVVRDNEGVQLQGDFNMVQLWP